MPTTPPHRPGPSGTPTTDPAPADPPESHPAHPAGPGALSCPECGEAVRAVPPIEWPLAGWTPRPGYAHHDGTPLCPVPGPGGSGPAEPVTAPARLTVWQAVRQSWLIHPDWTVADHLAWLDDEAYDLEAVDGDPATVIAGWLAEHRRTAPDATAPDAPGTMTGPTPPVPATLPEVVYVVAGGNMVAAFANEWAAGVQDDVMTLAGLDTATYRLTWARWVQVRAELRTRHPETEIIDVSGGDPA
ncbi:hypothetical protein [Dactylosporangium sp. NPDC051484]|uniref:hypothetical protein n=1 Tax=Dactylosporangium sp. NPDC051484 TaxID=3154942 RepID=UPI00344CB6DE